VPAPTSPPIAATSSAAVSPPAATGAAAPAADPLANPMFLCPITQDVMTEPVLAADGYTYDKHAIQVCAPLWLQQEHDANATSSAGRHYLV
jgi:hypothetical protein